MKDKRTFTGEYDFSNTKWFSPKPKTCILTQPCANCGVELSLDLVEAELEYPKAEDQPLSFYCDSCDGWTNVLIDLSVNIKATITHVDSFEMSWEIE